MAIVENKNDDVTVEPDDSGDPEDVLDEAEVRETGPITPELVDDDSDEDDDALFQEMLPILPRGELVKYDPLDSYLSEIKHIPTLSREEEHALALRFKEQGDKLAGYKLVMANLRLVVMVAKEYQRNFRNILDLVQEGNIGLLEAVKKYDPYRGIRFPSYAVYWVRAYMLRYLINNLRLVKIGTTQAQRKLFFNLRKEQERLEQEGFLPEAKLLADRLDVKESEVIEMQQRLALPDLSVDAPLGGVEDAGDMHGVLPDEAESIEDQLVRRQFDESVRGVVDKLKDSLDEKEQAIIEQRLLADEPCTLQHIAEQFDLSRERIRQIESKLKDKIKEALSDQLQLGSEGEIVLNSQELSPED
ncbi:MAG: RNA polymerase factor sigma-32 [Bdellovibrionales bacterium]|nr:RNA polymerase factor sigma-32 [Bdellovibrionales bacterium]